MSGFRTLKEYFQGCVQKVFGTDLENIFNSESSQSNLKTTQIFKFVEGDYVAEKRVITSPETGTVVGYYLNGKACKPFPKNYEDKLELVDEREEELGAEKCYQYLPDVLASGNLGYNLTFDSDLTMIIRSDIPGVPADRVEITFAGENLRVNVLPKMEDELAESSKEKMLVGNNLMDLDQGADFQQYIDTSSYSIKDLKCTIENGRLEIRIPWCVKATASVITFKPKVTNAKRVKKPVPVETAE